VKAYVIYHAEVLDADRYEDYKRVAAASIAAAGGTYLVRGGDPAALEGALPSGRTVILEFPSREVAMRWYESEEYSRAKALRDGVAHASAFVVDGYE